MTGAVTRLISEKGFGFIKPDQGGEELFFHRSAVQGARGTFEAMKEGDRVGYEPGEGPKGARAERVTVLD